MSDELNASSDEGLVTPDRIPTEPRKGGLIEREGLPPTYRMRADRHYVDQLAAPAGSHPVRAIATADIDAPSAFVHDDLRPLIESIRAAGIVHPLIVRREQARYRIVSGRKRFFAAQTLRLQTVPCLIHDVSENEAAAIQAADNLTIGAAPAVESRPDVATAHEVLERHLSAIRRCVDLSLDGRLTGLDRFSMQLLQAHAWRAERLLGALRLITAGTPRQPAGTRPVAAVIDEVIAGFRTELSSTGTTIRAEIGDTLPRGFDAAELYAAVSAALLAIIPIVQDAERATIVIRATASNATLNLQIVQTDVAVPKGVADHFFDERESGRRPGGVIAAIGALGAKAFAERHGGHVAFEPLDHGSRLVMTLSRAV